MSTLFEDLAAVLDPLVASHVWASNLIPPTATPPYIGILADGFPASPALAGDAQTLAWFRQCQIDLWQDAADETGEERLRNVIAALDGLQLQSPRLRARVTIVVRAPEDRPSSIVHDAITVSFGQAR